MYTLAVWSAAGEGDLCLLQTGTPAIKKGCCGMFLYSVEKF
jgi:hypothetical protein